MGSATCSWAWGAICQGTCQILASVACRFLLRLQELHRDVQVAL